MSCPNLLPALFRGRSSAHKARCPLAWGFAAGLATLVGLGLCGPAFGAGEEPRSTSIPGLAPAGGAKPAEQDPSLYPDPEGRAKTSMFGVPGVGFKFVYVLDRSGSMGGSGHVALKAVKAELQRSLRHLDTVHQFQIIFYNEWPSIFNPSGTPGRLAFATQANKDRAVRFIESITAEGGTRHDEALKLAIKLRPDVIFFLTDGDDPKLTRHELDTIHRMAGGMTINAIEFGMGPRPEEKSFLATLAEENGGKYGYVDLSKRRTEPAER